MDSAQPGSLVTPSTIAEAITHLEEDGEKAGVIAGATWEMRRALHRKDVATKWVSLKDIPKLHELALEDDTVSIGSMCTHATLVEKLPTDPDLTALVIASSKSANPSVRRMATIGGNVCVEGFSASDLVPALLACGANVELQSSRGTKVIGLEDFIADRKGKLNGSIVTRLIIQRSNRRSTHQRILLRKAGEYPTANLSLAVATDNDNRISDIRIFVGSVEEQPKRWAGLEKKLIGAPLDPIVTKEAAGICILEFEGRDGVDAPGWYRTRLLPRLAADAVVNLNPEPR